MNRSEASHAQINVNGRLDAVLSGASSLKYSGLPTLGNINTSGASTVSSKLNPTTLFSHLSFPSLISLVIIGR